MIAGKSQLLIVIALVLMPVVAIFSSWLNIDVELWRHFADTRLLSLIINTLQLLIMVAIGSAILGISLAWLVSHYEFHGRRWLELALVLPMALPAYVVAFVFLGLFDFTGPIQSWLRQQGLQALTINDVRHPLSVSLVIISVLYP